MRCLEASELMSLCLDDSLTEEQDRALQHHVEACEACASLWHDMESVSALFVDVPLADPPPTLQLQVMSRVRRRSVWVRFARRGLVLALGLLVFAGLVIVPLFGIVTTTLNQPAVAQALVGLFVRMVEILRILTEAGRVMIGSLFVGSGRFVVVGYVGLAGLLLAGWARLVSMPVRGGVRGA